jgi:hypothetical protein
MNTHKKVVQSKVKLQCWYGERNTCANVKLRPEIRTAVIAFVAWKAGGNHHYCMFDGQTQFDLEDVCLAFTTY